MDDPILAPSKNRRALIVCDFQEDLLKSIPSRESLESSLKVSLAAARQAGWLVIFSGLRFPSGYAGVDPSHRLYGALARLNARLGDRAVHWFMEGHSGSDIATETRDDDIVVWRRSHVPHELATMAAAPTDGDGRLTSVVVVGAKASGSVQASCQVLVDEGVDVKVVRECVGDDDDARLEATLEHLLPVYAKVISLKDMIVDAVGGMAEFAENMDEESERALVSLYGGRGAGNDVNNGNIVKYCTDCGRRGHGRRFIQLFLKRPGWQNYPTQTWYEHFIKGEFLCPLGKKVVDFCDEPEFSRLSMYIAGREWLDEKDKVVSFAKEYMPVTYVLDSEGHWEGGRKPPTDSEDGAMDWPWFVKEADKNLGGAAIGICQRPSEIKDLTKLGQRYVVQQHVKKPLLTDDGRKAHLKFYSLLVCEEDGVTWALYTYRGALLSISPNRWSPDDLSHDTQITIHRHPEHPSETKGWRQHWTSTYAKCQKSTAEVIRRAVETKGTVKGRLGKKQFEVFSVDWMPDEDGNIWMFEFNLSPAVAQAEFDDVRKRDARRDILMRHDETMLQEALDIVKPWEKGGEGGQWEKVREFSGVDYLK
uniref:Isochorismatase-like domain-containing protein n=1 Tax=Corethron hystrix TaxID=216773 RepID=A0A7S1G2Y8_9STRA|mmetsp:Transcript_9521/g.21120  ORF Transcript_9521/g.21120 Transcript_9521/m.21120 type:complete len:591 (+) Transcript_9521:39-1811(+)